jgi:hypothetical protein
MEQKKKNPLKISAMLAWLIILLCIGGAVWLSTQNLLEAQITGYEQAPDILPIPAGSYVTQMLGVPVEDIRENPNDYLNYFISISIKNISPGEIYDIDACLAWFQNGVWMGTKPNAFAEWQIDLKAQDTYNGLVYVIIKTKGMDAAAIDKTIKNLGIVISAKSIRMQPFGSSKTVYMKDS